MPDFYLSAKALLSPTYNLAIIAHPPLKIVGYRPYPIKEILLGYLAIIAHKMARGLG